MSSVELELVHERGAFRLEADARLDAPVVGLFGPSGAGKSTLLDCLAGLERPERGRIVLDGEVVFDSDAGVWVPPHRRGVGYVFQDDRLFPHLSVRGNLTFGLRAARPGGPELDEVVERFELGALLDRRTTRLSGGERQRVGLARALLANPRLFLLDEPLSALDRRLRAQIAPFLRSVRELSGAPMLYVSHQLAEILQLTRSLLLVEGGRTVAQGRLVELVREGRITHGDLDNVLELVVDGHEPATGLTFLRAPSGAVIAGSELATAVGARVHVGLRPEDVVLAHGRVDKISTRNQLEGQVVATTEEGRRVLVLVDAGVELFVEVTPGALRELDLRPGRSVVCLFKANALRYLDALPVG